MKLSAIAARLGARLDGADAEISGVAGIEAAQAGQLTFVANPKYAAAAKTTEAAAVIVVWLLKIPGLLLVGGGPMEKTLRQQAEMSRAAQRIHFVGRVPHEDVERYYSLIDVLVYPRKKMRLTDLVTPLKPLEAMAQRRLVAASDVGGHRELIEDGVTGTLFPPDDPVALAESVAGLFAMQDRWDERRNIARAYVERDRNWSSNISRYGPVYHKLTGKPV